MADSKRKKVLDAALKALLASADAAWWLKGPAVFVAELSAKFGNLPDDQRKALMEATPDTIREALDQINLATKHSAYTAAGVDRIENRIEELCKAIQTLIEQTKPVKRDHDPTAYLRRLRRQTESIDIRGLEVGSGKATRLPIDKLYIPLATTGSAVVHRGEKHPKDLREEFDELRAESRNLRETLQHRCLVIVGDPGSGKSTFLRRVTFELCRKRVSSEPPTSVGADVREPKSTAQAEIDTDALDPGNSARTEVRGSLEEFLPASHPVRECFPILVRLADLVRHVETCHDRKVGHLGHDAPRWLTHYAATECLENSDSLDESYFEDRLKASDTVVLLDGLDEPANEKQRVTARKLIEKAAQAYPCRFVVTTRPATYRGEVLLTGFEEARIAALDDEAIRGFLRTWCGILWKEIEREIKKHLAELLVPIEKRPEIRRLARNPVMLTALAVVHWNEKRLPEQRADLYESIIKWLSKSRPRENRRAPENCVSLLQNLALAMQDHPQGRQTQVTRHWGARAIAASFRDHPEEGERIAAAETFLKEEEGDSGIVVGRGEHEIRFWHLTFQEYLAARALSARPEAELAQRLLQGEKPYRPEWREVLLLLAGVFLQRGPELVDGLFATILDQLGDKARLEAKARCAGLLGTVLSDLSALGYQPADKRYAAILSDALAVFDAKKSQAIPIAEAIQAAEAIGQAGDPRFTKPDSPDLWVTIPAGKFLMGAQKKKPNYDEETYDDESPVHEVHLSEYRIGRYPLTVAEYQRFVDHEGYTEKEFEKSYWKAGGFGKWENPQGWDEQLRHLNRPVTGVSWYEAAAYAAWAGFRLPTEAEWERAARGTDARKFPWGGEKPESNRLNYDRNVGNPTPVGVYPRGATSDGIQDMAGNVWEWCEDWYGNYSKEPQVDPKGPSSGDSRVFRGGSWSFNAGWCRSVARHRLGPGNRGDGIGFRVVSAGT